MNILGIIWEHCSTAAVMIDGRVVACVSEERFTRKKNDEVYPKQAVESVLRQAGLEPNEIDVVALAGERFDPQLVLCHKSSGYDVQDRLREQREFWYPRMYEHKDIDYLEVFSDKLDTSQYPGDWDAVLDFIRTGSCSNAEHNAFFQDFRREVVHRHLGVDPAKMVFPHHHRCHALYAYFGSPLSGTEALVLTADAWGDDMNAMVSVARDGGIHTVSSSQDFNLARLYRSMTLLMGMKPNEHEYKVMGLAPYAKAKHYAGALEVFRKTMYVDGVGVAYHEVPSDMYVYFQRHLEGFRFDSIAGALQQYTEEILVEWARNCLRTTGTSQLCFGGGLAMNVKAMLEIAKLDELERLFVCPSPSDESLAIGACYAVAYDSCRKDGRDPREVLKPLSSAYLGPDLAATDVRAALDSLDRERYELTESVDLKHVADVLARGRIIGRCVGPSEFGARALGNRSILGDPRRSDVVLAINDRVKSRDFWMPFAPSILEERAEDYLVNPKQLHAPYMTVAFETTPRAHSELPAGLHQSDRTARPQVVVRNVNPGYHELISEFEQRTGVGGVLNTSFNIHGEPIVQTAADAVSVLERTGLDALILGNLFIEKRASAEGTDER